MKEIKFEEMSVEEYEQALQRRVYLRDGEREMGFWRKFFIFLWMVVVALMIMEITGIAPAISANAMACGVLAIIGIPAALIADYNLNYKKGW